jgi:hypothetical protein
MKKMPDKTANKKTEEPVPFDKKVINLSEFKPDISEKMLENLFPQFGGPIYYYFTPIEILSCTKTLGKGRTNLTIIVPTIVQIDAATPRASFDRRSTPSRNPVIQMHFEPGAYGITGNATYIMTFNINSYGQSTFNLQGYAGSGTISNNGTKVLNGPNSVSLIMKNVPPSQQTYGYLEQTAGGAWDWFNTQVNFPPLVIKL